MRYTIGSRDWRIVVDDVHDNYSAAGLSIFAERHHDYLNGMREGETCTADIPEGDGIRCAFIRKRDGIIEVDRMVFPFTENGETVEREMTHSIECV